MIATAFNRYQDLNLVCNDAHFARYLLLEAAIAMLWVHSMPTSQSSLHQLRICGILTSHSSIGWFRAYLCITAGLVSFEFAAYLSLIPLCLLRVSCVPGPRDTIMLCFNTGSLTASCYTVSL